MIYFDVGANDGSSMVRFAEQGHTVLAFEPNPEFYMTLRHHYNRLPNCYWFYTCAVSDYDGQAEFNVCEQADRGCSSLLELSETGKTAWGGRTDMIPSTKTQVRVARLDTMLDWNKIPEIEFFHCDTQGSDLKVLIGMGQYLNRIKAGVVEAAAKPDILYKNQNSLSDTADFLHSHGFKVTRIESNDIQGNEVNIFFNRIENNSGNTSI